MKRRQQFITDGYYRKLIAFHDSARTSWLEDPLEGDTPDHGASLTAYEVKMSAFNGLMLRYTAGEDISTLAVYLEALVEAYEQYQYALGRYHGEVDISPLNIEDIVFEYEEFVQVVSFCILLHRNDLLSRFVRLTDRAGLASQDVLYEDLLKKSLPNRFEVDEYYHDNYESLIEAVYAESPAEASALLLDYCSGWYQSFAKIPNYWHDTHLTMTETDGAYFGYWALEAAAIAYLYDIDDSGVDHMVYPRDLVEYARSYKPDTVAAERGKVYAGQPCIRTGYWFSPAQSNSRRFFTAGEIMPEFKGSSWGATIWYWSGEE
ncbi:DUF1911 domain-containing protein [Pseudomonas fakonensis]|uniref:DUF1911 domain-containing protein n=1 Tax=Pseudomonas fakonensis TaxID=2842355 RepID=A0ABX8N007_9PSED|nr:PoNe immunity protein domain-containing protein [Pseudomonas fakonensis]QXH49166.1 DUF1911 domain-containing protein [Pseudomonas fakonensis]